MLEEGFFIGKIRHNRYKPKSHRFEYSMYWSLLDLELVEANSNKYSYLSSEKWNILSFRAKDFFCRHNKTNKGSIQDFIKEKTGKCFSGKVLLLSHLRFLGFNFNSVSFYFCINKQGVLEHIVSEITNTPWGERHPYLLSCDNDSKRGDCYIFNFEKEFHISPFVSMEMDYQWLFKIEQNQLRIHMKVNKKNAEPSQSNNSKVIDVTFTGNHLPLSQSNINRMLLKHSFQPLKMAWRIYWQALKLWLKKIPFYSHPKYSGK
ncbi:MAG: DUF1365 domain-containing protein [Gammaproteobacteria bacterium]|nr:DUF1365 domain-containing protein [Gammaproteobacteria bacterium]